MSPFAGKLLQFSGREGVVFTKGLFAVKLGLAPFGDLNMIGAGLMFYYSLFSTGLIFENSHADSSGSAYASAQLLCPTPG